MAPGASSSIRDQVDSLFKQLRAKRDICRNPVTGMEFEWGVDSISEQKLEACRALVAREWHAHASPGAPILPVDFLEIDALKSGGGETHLFGYFAQSIHCRYYQVAGHPPWETFARGVLASPYAPDFFKQDQELLRKFPPRRMTGLSPFDLIWQTPEDHATTMQYYTFACMVSYLSTINQG